MALEMPLAFLQSLLDTKIYIGLIYCGLMTQISLESLNQEIQEIKLSLAKITHILQEEYELSDEAMTELSQARKEPVSSYVEHEKVVEEFL